jgi:hypothetical protein
VSRRLLAPAGAALAAAIVLSPLAATAASAQEVVTEDYSGGGVLPTTEVRDTPLPSGVGSETAERSELPFTGGDVALVGIVAAGALAGGAVLVVAGRRRSGAGAAA